MVEWLAICLDLRLKVEKRTKVMCMSHFTYLLLQLKQKFDDAQKQVKELLSQLQLLQTKVCFFLTVVVLCIAAK